jgi:hypothetical protein
LEGDYQNVKEATKFFSLLIYTNNSYKPLFLWRGVPERWGEVFIPFAELCGSFVCFAVLLLHKRRQEGTKGKKGN